MDCRWRSKAFTLTEVLVTMALLGLATVLTFRLLMALARPDRLAPLPWARSLKALQGLRLEVSRARFVLHPRPTTAPRRGRSLIWVDWDGAIRALAPTPRGLSLLDVTGPRAGRIERLPFPADASFFVQHRGRHRRTLRLRLRCGGRMVLTAVELRNELDPVPVELLCAPLPTERSPR